MIYSIKDGKYSGDYALSPVWSAAMNARVTLTPKRLTSISAG